MKQLAFAILLVTAQQGIAAQARVQSLQPRKPTANPPVVNRTAESDPRAPGSDDPNARETRERFSELLRQYPPSLAEVLRLDPSLMTNEGYLTPYPGLAGFLVQHPEIPHNPAYFIGEIRFNSPSETTTFQKIRLVEETLAGFAFLMGFVAFLAVIGWVLKSVIEYRRWMRQSKVQTEVHTKLLDRFTANDDLLAYIQTPVGRRFLEAAPIPIEAAPKAIGAPIGRILWSVQAGLVVGLAGVGLLLVSTRMAAAGGEFGDISQVPFVLGMLSLAIGAGFVISSIVAYAISRRLGLLEPPAVAPHA